MSDFPLSIITPSGKIFDQQVTAVRAPGVEGSFGVMAGHAPFVARLSEGVVKLEEDGGTKFFGIFPGILEVGENGNVVLLTDSARPAGSYDEAQNLSKSVS